MEQQGINPPFIVTDGLTKTYIRREKPENGGITRLWRRETREVQALRDPRAKPERAYCHRSRR